MTDTPAEKKATITLDAANSDHQFPASEVFPQASERRLEDGSTHTVQTLTDAGETCVQQECTAAREEKRLRQEQYSLRAAIEGVLDQVRDMADDDRITAEVAAELRKSLRDALGLDKQIS